MTKRRVVSGKSYGPSVNKAPMDKKKTTSLIIALAAVVFAGCCIWGYKMGYDAGISDGEAQIQQWMDTHEKYRLVIDRIWEDVKPETKKKYESK